MSVHGSWDELVIGLCDLAVKYDAETFLYEDVVLLSSRKAEQGNDSRHIRVTRFDDEAARVETGWCFAMTCDYIAEDRSRPVPALGLVEAICSGNAEEHCLIDAEGRWVGIQLRAWAPNGDGWQSQSGGHAGVVQHVVRRFPSWIDPN
ncbi:hypothetical protein IRT45_17050 [Nocardia sp. BSTN01]|uniref:hypothetical protein n=1 Tax=Nocardia sp. BSTN01 TaxID=2783665 RepID=UPI00188E2922|nr:hypothetical protein [Nocardia sp. BSTN01]MBF4998857.1 hypothetical protein [Nocardia sp. BSTN01]